MLIRPEVAGRAQARRKMAPPKEIGGAFFRRACALMATSGRISIAAAIRGGLFVGACCTPNT